MNDTKPGVVNAVNHAAQSANHAVNHAASSADHAVNQAASAVKQAGCHVADKVDQKLGCCEGTSGEKTRDRFLEAVDTGRNVVTKATRHCCRDLCNAHPVTRGVVGTLAGLAVLGVVGLLVSRFRR